MKKIQTSKIPTPTGPFSQAVEVNGIIYTSGQLPFDPETHELEVDDIVAATHNCMKAITAIANEASKGLEDCFKFTIYLRDINDYKVVNEIYSSYINFDVMPVRSAFEVANLPFGVPIEIEAMIKL